LPAHVIFGRFTRLMSFVPQVHFLRPWLVAGVMGLAGGIAEAQTAPVPRDQAVVPGAETVAAGHKPGADVVAVSAEEPVKLERVDVEARLEDAGYDATGMGSYEHQVRDSPFSNDMISAEAIEDDPAAMEIASELAFVATPSVVDLATGDSRVGLRGFPTPLLSNGFVRMGGIDVLNTGRTVVIQGALVPVLGRAAPGGIQDFWTNRPRTAKSQRVDYAISSLERQSASMEINGPAVPKRLWHRLAADWSRKTGPETFTASETRSINGALTWKHSPAASTLFSIDYYQTHATAAPAIPEYRVATGQKIVGPYLPLAGFNALGPEAGVRRRSMVANVILDAQPHPKVAVRAGLEAWWRRIEQDRFTTGLLNLATGRFEGIREPRHSEQPQRALVGRAEATGRFAALRGEHKLMFAASHTISEYYREERALSLAARNALPASIRNFDPATPNYWRPPYDPAVYDRVLTDRRENTRYTALELSERMGLAKGRTVFTTGLRYDLVGLKVNDRRPGLPPAQARLDDAVSQLTYHGGVNYQALPSRLLLFATASTAFNPSTRVDLRTAGSREMKQPAATRADSRRGWRGSGSSSRRRCSRSSTRIFPGAIPSTTIRSSMPITPSRNSSRRARNVYRGQDRGPLAPAAAAVGVVARLIRPRHHNAVAGPARGGRPRAHALSALQPEYGGELRFPQGAFPRALAQQQLGLYFRICRGVRGPAAIPHGVSQATE
jgi:hypothetical protein